MTDPMQRQSEELTVALRRGKARLGFIGVGWVGRSRLKVLADSSLAEICAVADPAPASLEAVASAPFNPSQSDSYEICITSVYRHCTMKVPVICVGCTSHRKK